MLRRLNLSSPLADKIRSNSSVFPHLSETWFFVWKEKISGPELHFAFHSHSQTDSIEHFYNCYLFASFINGLDFLNCKFFRSVIDKVLYYLSWPYPFCWTAFICHSNRFEIRSGIRTADDFWNELSRRTETILLFCSVAQNYDFSGFKSSIQQKDFKLQQLSKFAFVFVKNSTETPNSRQ